MGYSDAVFLLIIAIILVGGSFWFVYYLDKFDEHKKALTQEICNSDGGRWNDCSNKCQIMNAGNPDVYCTQVCERLCECGTIAGLSCPAGYECKMPIGIADAQGYCE